jgi:hypothetical protein
VKQEDVPFQGDLYQPRDRAPSVPVPVARTTRGQQEAKRFIPSIDQFYDVNTEINLKNLEGEDTGEEIDLLTTWPNSLWVHPSIFVALNGVKHTTAAEAALAIISLLTNADDDEATAETLEEDAKDSYRLLIYLWVCCQGFTHPIVLADSPDSESMDTKAQEVLAKLSPRREVSTKLQVAENPPAA